MTIVIERPHNRLKGYPVPPCSTAQIQHVATEFRRSIGGEFQESLEMITEYLIHERYLHVMTDQEVAQKGVEGYYSPAKECIVLSDSAYAACLDRSNPRALFTLAHELGHMILGHELTLRRESGSTGDHRIYEDSEWQANTFASELLMPEEIIRTENLSLPEQLCDRFGVSLEAAKVRLKKLGLLCT